MKWKIEVPPYIAPKSKLADFFKLISTTTRLSYFIASILVRDKRQ